MIKNDRQYRLSKTQARLFESAIHNLRQEADDVTFDPGIVDVQKRALISQLDELNTEVFEYEALRDGKTTVFEAQSLDELPTMLVKARIARGMLHRDLAERLNLKEQQIQRWESNDYSGASIENLKAVADALGVVLVQRMFVPSASVTAGKFLSSLKASGMMTDFILNKILSPALASRLKTDAAELKDIVSAASAIARVFGLKMRDLVELKTPQLDFSVVASTRFKLPARANKETVSGYTVYAHYLAATITECIDLKPKTALPNDYREFFDALTEDGKPMTFAKLNKFLWDCGVIVLPLRDEGGFHGAVWKIGGRFIIALKQTTGLESRWLFDALHECAHIHNGDVTDEVSLIEDEEISPENSGDLEEAANEWAEEVLFNGQVEKIEDACESACRGKLQNLKLALPKVAHEFNVNVGSVANLMAYRLAGQGQNWWGTAHNLQQQKQNPFEISRELLLQHLNLSCLSVFDRELLQRALSDE